MAEKKLRSAVFISGGGTTFRNLLCKIRDENLPLDIRLVVSSKATAGGLAIASEAGIPSLVVTRQPGESDAAYSARNFEPCRTAQVDYVLMGGYLKHVLIPDDFAGRVVNIHPSLIPSFCGQGMYGLRVHQSVLEYGAKLSGCTVHFVDNQFDHGPIILQRAVIVLDDDTPQSLAARVFAAECEAYPEVIRALADGRVDLQSRRVRVRPVN